MPLFLIPYALQLMCIVHAVKNHRDTYWIWIILFVPYIGGLAYIIVEVLPGFTTSKSLYAVKNTLIDFIKPNEQFEKIQQRAEFSPSHKNMIDYADALLDRKEYDKALTIYENQNAGVFKNDLELLYRIALVQFYLGNYDSALQMLNGLFSEDAKLLKKSRECLLYLQILEKTEDVQRVKAEYHLVNQRIQNNSIEIPFLSYLIEQKDYEEARSVFNRIRQDEKSMKINSITYDRSFYREVYRLEKAMYKQEKQ